MSEANSSPDVPGGTEPPLAEASVIPMEDLRLAVEVIDALVKCARNDLEFIQRRSLIGDAAMNALKACRSLETLQSLAYAAIKQKAGAA